MSDREPFDQIPFDDLPQDPPRPHAYGRTASESVEVDSAPFGTVETHYRRYGRGSPLLLIHGLMTSSYAWRYVFTPLSDDFELYAPDLPGAGATEKPLGVEYDPRHLADWLASFRRAVGIVGAPTVGNSLGGYLAMWEALRTPNEISAVINVHGPGIPTLRLRALSAVATVPGITRLIAWLARRHPERWAHEHIHYYDETLKSREEAAVYGKPLSMRTGSLAFAKYLTETLDTGAMSTFVEHLERRRREGRRFPAPLLLLYAARDPMVPPSTGERLAELVPDADVQTLEGVSHFVQVDAPERFAEAVRGFLDDTAAEG